VEDIRGRGLMLGIALNRACPDLVRLALDHRLLVSLQAERVIRLLPPLVLGEEEAYQLITILETVIREYEAA